MKIKDRQKLIDGLQSAIDILNKTEVESEPQKGRPFTVGDLKQGEFAIAGGMGILCLSDGSVKPTQDSDANVVNLSNGIGNFPKHYVCVKASAAEAFALAVKQAR